MARYKQRIFPPASGSEDRDLSPMQRKRRRRLSRRSLEADPQFEGYLKKVEIVMNNRDGCEKFPYLDMEEDCKFN